MLSVGLASFNWRAIPTDMLVAKGAEVARYCDQNRDSIHEKANLAYALRERRNSRGFWNLTEMVSASHDLEGLPEKRNRHPFRTER